MTIPCPIEATVVLAPRICDGPLAARDAEPAPDNEFQVPVESLLGAIITLCGASGAAVRLVAPESRILHLVGSAGVFPARDDTAEHYGCPSCPRPGTAGDGICRCAPLSPPDLQAFAVQLRHRRADCGLLTLYFPVGTELPAITLPLLRSLSDVLGLALENARLALENSRLADAHLRSSLMQERQLLANEVHDSLAQNLACMRMRATLLRDALQHGEGERAGKYLAEVEESLTVAHGRVRELITQFRTAMDPLGLLHALQTEIASLNGLGGVELAFDNQASELALPAEQEMQVLHIVREAVANVVKHARARHGRVTLSGTDGHYQIAVEDDGVGLAASGSGGDSEHGHFGLNIMRERAQHLGGEVRIDSAPAGGTRVLFSFSVPRTEART